MRLRYCAFWLLAVFPLFFSSAFAQDPIATDTRIRTLVYGENEVFKVTTLYGFQTNIEFGVGEKIKTISVGDPVAFKVTPAENRIFIKALKEGEETNMTVVTSRYAYQIDISSVVEDPKDITYVARFYYPEDDFDLLKEKGEVNSPLTTERQVARQYNFNYTLTGPAAIAPIKVFDNGRLTFFKFPNNNQVVPAIFAVNPDGTETRMVTRENGEHIVVERVLPKYALRLQGDIVCVFNEGRVQPAMAQRRY